MFQGQKNKLNAYHVLTDQIKMSADNIAYMGDDLPDAEEDAGEIDIEDAALPVG